MTEQTFFITNYIEIVRLITYSNKSNEIGKLINPTVLNMQTLNMLLICNQCHLFLQSVTHSLILPALSIFPAHVCACHLTLVVRTNQTS